MPLSYWHSGGDIVGPGRKVISSDQADAAALQLLSATADPVEARRLIGEIEAALAARARWRRAALNRPSSGPRTRPGC